MYSKLPWSFLGYQRMAIAIFAWGCMCCLFFSLFLSPSSSSSFAFSLYSSTSINPFLLLLLYFCSPDLSFQPLQFFKSIIFSWINKHLCEFTSLFVHLCAILPSGYGVAVWVCLAELFMGFRHKLKVCYFLNTRSNVLFLPAVNFAKIYTKCGQGKEVRVWEEIKWFLLLHFTTDIPEQTLMSTVHFSPGFPLPLSLSIFQFTSVTQLVLLQRVVEKKILFS